METLSIAKNDTAADIVPFQETKSVNICLFGDMDLPINPANVANKILEFIKNHLIITDQQAAAVTLWVISTYLYDCFRTYPILALISPEKRCGKTTFLEIIEALCRNGKIISNTTPAVVFRIKTMGDYTLIFDEADTFLKNGLPDLVGIFNSGFNKRGANVMRCDGDSNVPKDFSTWYPKVVASIGDLASTIMDRSLTIRLKRKKSEECVKGIPVNLYEDCKDLREIIDNWASNYSGGTIKIVQPADIGNDRAVDCWTPLFSIARILGGSWEDICLSSYRELTKPSDLEIGTQLLADLYQLFERRQTDTLLSAHIIEGLCEDETSLWHESNNGRKVSANQIARLLKCYDIVPCSIRVDGMVRRGYKREWFKDAFERYVLPCLNPKF